MIRLPHRRLSRLAFALYTAAFLAACSSHDAQPQQQPQQQPQALQFKLPDLSGTAHALSDYRGRWVLVNYWATWCKPCLEELPQLSAVAGEYDRHDVVILGIDYENLPPDELYRFIHEHHLGYAVLRTDPTAAQALGPVLGLPTTYLISPRGHLAATLMGPVTRADIERLLDKQARRRGLEPPARHPDTITGEDHG